MGRPNQPWYRKQTDTWVTKVGGKQVTLARGREARKEAYREFARLMAEEQARPTGWTLDNVADEFLLEIEREKAPRTFEWYRNHLLSWVAFAGKNTDPAALKPHQVTAWCDSHAWARSTRHGAITAAKRLSRWARRQGYCKNDPLAEVAKPGIARREHTIDQATLERVLAETDRAFADFLIVLWETGARPSEVMRLEAAQCDASGGTAVMPGKTTSRTGRQRVIYLTDRASEVIRRGANEGPALRNSRGKPWTRHSTATRWRRLRKRLGLGPEATSESLRHSWVTDALERGVPIATVAELAGHSDTTMVSRVYSKLHERQTYLAEAARKVRSDSS